MPSTGDSVADAFAEHWSAVVAVLIGTTRDWDLAMDCAQDAFAAAVQHWEATGVPEHPRSWLITTARNRAIDRSRRRNTERKALEILVSQPRADDNFSDPDGIADDQLRLIFTCCHPALGWDARVALTLRAVAGLSTAEIARAFMVAEPTMAQRLTRAKRKIANAGVPFALPDPKARAERLDAVLAVLYLLFNEGYLASAGDDLLRQQLCTEAIQLARSLVELMPTTPETKGLLALLLLHDARRPARVDAAGRLVTLEDQDRSLWRRNQIDEGVAMLDRALAAAAPGPYQVQAAIAACHDDAAHAADTDWSQIAALYATLVRMRPGPVVELNRAIAVAMAEGPAAGLTLLDRLDKSDVLADYYLLPAARADLLRRAGQLSEARDAYDRAITLSRNDAERRFLIDRRNQLPG